MHVAIGSPTEPIARSLERCTCFAADKISTVNAVFDRLDRQTHKSLSASTLHLYFVFTLFVRVIEKSVSHNIDTLSHNFHWFLGQHILSPLSSKILKTTSA